MDYIEQIENMGACESAVDWLRAEKHPTLAAAWAACPRGDWLLWLVLECAGNDQVCVLLALAAADCAELGLHYIPVGEDRPRQAIEIVRAWARGEATIEQVEAAGVAAAGAAGVTSGPARAAACACWSAVDAVTDADNAASACWYVGAAAGAVQRRAGVAALAQCADIVRRRFPIPPVLPTQPCSHGRLRL